MKRTLTIEITQKELDAIRNEILYGEYSECSMGGAKDCKYVLAGIRRLNECFGCKNENVDVICKCINQIDIDKSLNTDSCEGCVYEHYDEERYKDASILLKEYFGIALTGENTYHNENEIDELVINII